MADKFSPSSFIPRGGAEYTGPTAVRSRYSSSIKLTTAVIIATVAALAAGGVFFYTQYLQSDLDKKKQELAQAQAAFDPEIIDELKEVDERIKSAQDILSNHTAVTPVFSVVESITLESVQITSLTITSPEEADEDDENTDKVAVTFIGVASDYAGVALQAQALLENEIIQYPVLTDFTLNDQGDVEFSVQFFLDQEYMAYETTL